MKVKLSGIGQSQQPQVLHQTGEGLHLGLCRQQVFLIGGIDSVRHGLQSAPQDSEWGTQFVGHVGGLVPAGFFGAGEAFGHPVEGIGQLSYLVMSLDGGAGGQVPLGNGLTGDSKTAQRGDDGAKQQSPDDQCDDRRSQRGDPEGCADARQELILAQVQDRRNLGVSLVRGEKVAHNLAFYLNFNGDVGFQFRLGDAAIRGSAGITHDPPFEVGQPKVERRWPCSYAPTASPTTLLPHSLVLNEVQRTLDPFPRVVLGIVGG